MPRNYRKKNHECLFSFVSSELVFIAVTSRLDSQYILSRYNTRTCQTDYRDSVLSKYCLLELCYIDLLVFNLYDLSARKPSNTDHLIDNSVFLISDN